MLFGTHDIARGPSTDFEYAVSHRMQDFWLAFLQDPVKGLPAQGWPAYAPGGNAMVFAWNGLVTQYIALSEFEKNCDNNTFAAVSGAVPPDSHNHGLP